MFKTKLVIGLFFFISSWTVFSQEQLGIVDVNNKIDKDLKPLSFYAGPVFQFASLDSNFSFFVGGKGVWAFNKKVLLGFEGYLLKSAHENRENKSKELSFSYGGVFVGYIFDLSPKINLIPTVLSSCGSVGERKVEPDGDYVFFKVTDDFMLFQPALEIEIAVIKVLKIGVGVNYRVSRGIDSVKYTDDDFTGLGGTIALKFGKS